MIAPAFSFDRDRAIELIVNGIDGKDEAIDTLDRWNDSPDGFNETVTAAIDYDAITRSSRDLCAAVYPLSLVEPQPLLAVNPGDGGPFLLDNRDWEHPDDEELDAVAFTVFTLERVVRRANEMLAERPERETRLTDAATSIVALSNGLRRILRLAGGKGREFTVVGLLPEGALWQRWCDTFTAADVADAEAQARALGTGVEIAAVFEGSVAVADLDGQVYGSDGGQPFERPSWWDGVDEDDEEDRCPACGTPLVAETRQEEPPSACPACGEQRIERPANVGEGDSGRIGV